MKRDVKFKVIDKHLELCYLFERRARPLCDVVVPRTLSDASLGQWEPRLSMIMKLIFGDRLCRDDQIVNTTMHFEMIMSRSLSATWPK